MKAWLALASAWLFCLLTSLAWADTWGGKVTRVADGDTITVLSSDKRQVRIRLWGIDAPEGGQAYGRSATRHAKQLAAGQAVKNSYKGERTEGLEPDEETKAFMNVARSNGEVRAVGYNEERRVEISTTEHPRIETRFYDPKTAEALTALIDFSKLLMSEFNKK